MSSCPSENELLECVEGRLAPERRTALDQHLDQCDACRQTVAGMVHESGSAVTVRGKPASGMRAAGDSLEPGTRLGRFVIERILGQGGMGVVYAARDPSL